MRYHSRSSHEHPLPEADAAGLMLLTPEELADLTEYKRPADQIKWLREKGIPFFIGSKGNPKVLWEVLYDRKTELKIGEVR